jgi:hypothetical protein
MGEMRNACNILIGKPEGKRPLAKLRRRWEESMGVCELDSSGKCKRPMFGSCKTVMNLRVP